MSQQQRSAVNKQQPAAASGGGGLRELQRLLETHQGQIKMALPRHLTPERMIRVAMTAVSSSPALAECTPRSIAACIVQASILGLEPSSVLGEAYLVPFNNKKTGCKECQLIPGYLGLVKLARNSGQVSIIDAQVVYESDEFDFEKGSDTWWRHKWPKTGQRGQKLGVWAGYVLKDGSKNFEYWSIAQIHEHRDKFSKCAYEYGKPKEERYLTGAWRENPDWMEKKTVIRQVVKLMPKSVELATALSLEERADAGIGQIFDTEVSSSSLVLGVQGAPELPAPTEGECLTKEQMKQITALATQTSGGEERLIAWLGEKDISLGDVLASDKDSLISAVMGA